MSDIEDGWIAEAKKLIEMEEYPEALKLIEHALEFNPKSSHFMYYKGKVHFLMKDYDAAILIP